MKYGSRCSRIPFKIKVSTTSTYCHADVCEQKYRILQSFVRADEESAIMSIFLCQVNVLHSALACLTLFHFFRFHTDPHTAGALQYTCSLAAKGCKVLTECKHV